MIAEVLFDETAIATRVAQLGAQISREYEGCNPIVIGVLRSSAFFVADLTRAISIPCEYDFIAVTRYPDGEGISFEKDTTASIEGRRVILVEDTIDTGLTLRYIVKTLRAREPASLEVCALLDRPQRRIADVPLAYRGFEIPDAFVVGYGLDYQGRYRELPALYAHGSWPA